MLEYMYFSSFSQDQDESSQQTGRKDLGGEKCMGFHGRHKFKDFKGLSTTQAETETGDGPHSDGTVFEKPVVG